MEITIKTVKVKKEGISNGEPYKILNIQDTNGNWYDSFEHFEQGETVQVEVKENGQYNPNIKRAGGKQSGGESFHKEPITTDNSILFQVCLKGAFDHFNVHGHKSESIENRIKEIVDFAEKVAIESKTKIRNLNNR